MKNFQFKKIIPYVVAVLIFILISLWYVSPIFQGKQLQQSDVIHFKGSVKEIVDYRKATGEEALWTNSMFGGMPAYQISVLNKTSIVPFFKKIVTAGLPFPANIIFTLFIGFFILLLVLKSDPWLSMVGAFAFAFSSYFFIYIAVGHNSQALAIALMPLVTAGIIMTFSGKIFQGGALTALAMALEINVNHIQMTYYMLILLGFIVLFELLEAIRFKKIKTFALALLMTIIAGGIAVLPNITNLWTSSEYVKETIRGKSELTENGHNKSSGLDKDYITAWSYGVGETFTLMIPDAKGGESEPIGNKKFALDNVDRQYREAVAQQSHYWGALPFTGGPVYVGALIVFLFVFGMFIVKGKLKWALLITTILAIMLSWGQHFSLLTDFFIHYVPFYNKFRAVSSILIVVEFTMPLLAILAVKALVDNPQLFKANRLWFFISLGATAGLTLLFIIMPTLFFNFITPQETDQFASYLKQGASKDQIDAILSNLEVARIAIFKASCWRSFAFIILGAAAIWVYGSMKKPVKYYLYAALGLLILIDLVPIDLRYFNNKNFVSAKQVETPYKASNADSYILQDTDKDFRVHNLTVGNFALDASNSYFHKSLGGYHAAKLRRYQDLIDHRILKEQDQLISTLKSNPPDSVLRAVLYNLTTMNMLNTKYFIYNPEAPPLRNYAAMGNAWFVNEVRWVNSADEEIAALDHFNPAKTAIVDKRFEEAAKSFAGTRDANAAITLTDYKPNYLSYQANNLKSAQLAVFSEIYYDKGWKAFIDGSEVPYLRANYVLRAMVIPAGNHKIEFKFEPKSYFTGEKIALAGSVILVLFIGLALYFAIRKKKKEAPAA